MDPRYADPQVTHLWSPEWTYATWHRIELAVMREQRRLGLINRNDTEGYFDKATTHPLWTAEDIWAIHDLEKTTKHDVAAFIQYMREWYEYQTSGGARWFHYGLTSSDLVDTAMGIRFNELGIFLDQACSDLVSATNRWTKLHMETLGRTHGQPAEPITLSHRASSWMAHLRSVIPDLLAQTRRMQKAKLSGPVGTFAHNPPEVESAAAMYLGLQAWGPGASQVMPRADLAAWANSAALLVRVLNKIATDLRLMNLLGEAAEMKAEQQIGSSAMPHKNNPIKLEQIGGMARLAAGYASMLQPVELWLERDISNSSVERVAIPDLWHVLLYSVRSMTDLLSSGVGVDPNVMADNLHAAGHAPYTTRALSTALWAGDSYEDARAYSISEKAEMDTPREPEWYLRNTGLGAV